MTTVTTSTKAYVLENINHNIELTLAERLKANQFLNLLTTCNLTVQVNSSLPEDVVLASYQLICIDFSSIINANTIASYIVKLTEKHKVALFNCAEGVLDEKSVLLAGFQGMFYADDRADIILKGIGALLGNERWFKRETMNIALGELLTNFDSSQSYGNLTNNEQKLCPSLTKREKTIISLVSSGAQNKEIANQLHISPNTVKTHIYSIFRKTSSRNRVELLSWSKQFQQVN